MATFPTSLPSYLGFTAGHTLLADAHASQHNSEQADITAIATKIGTGASTPVNQRLLRGNGTGTSAWAQANLTSDVTGVLPVANGGTGTTSTTGTGSVVFSSAPTLTGGSWGGSPTITTPTIASFTNAQHNHQNAAGGGTLSATAITSLDLTNTTLKNPYKFSVYQTNAQTINAASSAVIAYDTATFDTNNNVDIVTNKGRYPAPVNGFYFFSAAVNFGPAGVAADKQFIIYLQKNGVEILRGNEMTVSVTAGTPGVVVSGLLQLAAGDFVEVGFNNGDTSPRNTNTGANLTYFHGFFFCNT